MGYTTEFEGQVKITPPLSDSQIAKLNAFVQARHEDGPSLYCQWVPNEDGTVIEWDGNEKFYAATEWMEYILENFLRDDQRADGIILAQGEEPGDIWRIVVVNNNVKEEEAVISFASDDIEDHGVPF